MTLSKVIIGFDVGDRYTEWFGVDVDGEIIEERRSTPSRFPYVYRACA